MTLFGTDLFAAIDKGDSKLFAYSKSLDTSVSHYCYRKLRDCENGVQMVDVLEEEADRIALQLLARSCYDVREVEKFIQKCYNIRKAHHSEQLLATSYHYIFKHNFNDHRKEFVANSMARFVQFRKACGCPPLE